MCNRTTCHDITSCGVPEVLFLMLLCFLCQTCLKNVWCFSCCSVWCSVNTDRKSGTADTLRHTLEISSRLKVDWQESSRQNWGSGPPHHSVRPGTQSDSGCQCLARVDSQSRSAWSPPETRGSRAAPHSVLWSRIWQFRPAEKPDPVQKLFQNKSLFSVWKKRTCESVELLSDFTLET